MSPLHRKRSAGYSLLELLFVTSLVATLAALSIPATAGALDEMRAAMAARYLEGRIMNARMTAIRRSTKVALRFEAVDGDYRFGEYSDGNGNGVRATDIASGIDREIAPGGVGAGDAALASRGTAVISPVRARLPRSPPYRAPL